MDNISRSFFKDTDSYREFATLNILADSDEPLGSWLLKEKLAEFQIELSIASIGRLLKELDRKGFTELIKNSGRKISVKGQRHLHSIKEDYNRYCLEKELIDASDPNNLKDLLDLLHARKILEIETARLAAVHATEEDIEKMEQSIILHSTHLSYNHEDSPELGCNFHELLGQASHNRFLCSLLNLLIHEEVDAKRKFPSLTVSQTRHNIEDHKEILNAIKSRNEEQVMRIMENHLNENIGGIKSSFKKANYLDEIKL